MFGLAAARIVTWPTQHRGQEVWSWKAEGWEYLVNSLSLENSGPDHRGSSMVHRDSTKTPGQKGL